MHEIEIAGLKISYKNVTDLNAKVVSVLSGIHRKRVSAEASFELFRKQEESIRKFLGGCEPVEEGPASAMTSDGN